MVYTEVKTRTFIPLTGGALLNGERTILKAKTLYDLPSMLPFYHLLDELPDYEVVEKTRGKLVVRENLEGRDVIISRINVVQMKSKAGNVSYFRAEIIKSLIKERSKLYLPHVEPSRASIRKLDLLLIQNPKMCYVIEPENLILLKNSEFVQEGRRE